MFGRWTWSVVVVFVVGYDTVLGMLIVLRVVLYWCFCCFVLFSVCYWCVVAIALVVVHCVTLLRLLGVCCYVLIACVGCVIWCWIVSLAAGLWFGYWLLYVAYCDCAVLV